MTKRDYALIAKVLCKARALDEESTRDGWEMCDEIVVMLADALAADNSAFKRDVFMRACVTPQYDSTCDACQHGENRP